MANYDLTPNIGLKNILIGERPWGIEERENKIILDTYLGSFNAYGRTKISLLPTNRINLSDPDYPQLSKHSELNLDCLVFTPQQLDTEVYWYISQSEFSDYTKQIRPFVSSGYANTTAGSDEVLLDYNPIEEIYSMDKIRISGIEYTVNAITENSLILDKPVPIAYTSILLNVVPSIGGRLKLNVLWSSNTPGDTVSWSLDLARLTVLELPLSDSDNTTLMARTVLDTDNNSIIQTKGLLNVLNNPSDTPVYVALKVWSGLSQISGNIYFLEANIQLAIPQTKLNFTNTYYNLQFLDGTPIDTTFSYDPNGNIVGSIETFPGSLKRTTEYQYNLVGDIVKTISELELIETTEDYIYDSASNIIEIKTSSRSLIV
jgi:hypothetical protein